jgi:cytochrome c oxidase subunit III
MTGERRVLDVSALPTLIFGHRCLLGWGTLGFMIIEGFTLVLAVASYLYLRTNEYQWPPGRTPDPELLIPTINTVLLLLVMIPMYRVGVAAKALDRRRVIRGLAIATLMTIPIMVLRWWDLMALQVRWDAHAYASAAWAVVVLHSTLIVLDFVECGLLAILFISGQAQKKHYPDANDAAGYQLFLSMAWVPLYLIIYWGPRLL